MLLPTLVHCRLPHSLVLSGWPANQIKQWSHIYPFHAQLNQSASEAIAVD
jgi:hypothetical protein